MGATKTVNYHEGRPIIRQSHGMTLVLCPYGHVYTGQPIKNWAGSWLEAKASDPTWIVRCDGALSERSDGPIHLSPAKEPQP